MHLPGKRSLIFLGALAALLAPVSAFQGGPCLLQAKARGGRAGGTCGVGGKGGVRMMAGESGEWRAAQRVVQADGGNRARSLRYWLEQDHGMDLSAITLKNSPLEGLGMFAARDLEPGETVFTIPRECTVYPEMVLEDRMLGKSMKALASKAGTGIETVALATFLAREKLVGSESSRRAYIEVLPWDSMHPLLWTDAEVDLLEDTYAYEEIMQFRDQVDTATELFEPVLNPKGIMNIFQAIDQEKQTPEEFAFLMRGAFASVLSRAFDSDLAGGSGESDSRVLVPMLDILNHSPKPSVTFDATRTKATSKVPVMTAGGIIIKEGEELFSSYGAGKADWLMLSTYGFLSQDVSSETVLEASLDPSDPLFSQKAAVLSRMGIAADGQAFNVRRNDCVEGGKGPANLLRFLRLRAETDASNLEAAVESPSAEVEGEARAAACQLATARLTFLEGARVRAREAAARGEETGVRSAAADQVCSLLSSESSACQALLNLSS